MIEHDDLTPEERKEIDKELGESEEWLNTKFTFTQTPTSHSTRVTGKTQYSVDGYLYVVSEGLSEQLNETGLEFDGEYKGPRIYIIATREGWIKLYHLCMNSTPENVIPFHKIEQYLSIGMLGGKGIATLKKYYDENSYYFVCELFDCCFQTQCVSVRAELNGRTLINYFNLTYTRKNTLTPKQRDLCRWVYVFLRYWAKKDEGAYPKAYMKFLEENDLIEYTFLAVGELTLKVVDKYLGESSPIKELDAGTFYTHYILSGRPLCFIKSALKKVKYQPKFYPLSDIFPE